MGEQASLFPGNRGCGKRDKSASVALVGSDGVRCVVVRLNIELESPNRAAFSRWGASGPIKKKREAARVGVLATLGANGTWTRIVSKKIDGVRVRGTETLPCYRPAPSRVVITRLSFGELDKDNAGMAAKPVWDGIADAFGLPNDRELQKSGDVQQSKCRKGTSGVLIELFFSG